ncbi:MAG: Beta-ketoacyl synthase, partial [Deltaproteobacteria bacterium]|nr:Beta-ketoacyl synthase [Deltaproteobacteria bacterium]
LLECGGGNDRESRNMTIELLPSSMPVISAGYLGPSLTPNQEAVCDEATLPLNPDELVQKMMGQPMRRAGRFIKLVCLGALACLNRVPPEELKEKKVGIFLATGLGNIDEILPFITQVFKHDGGFPSPNQFANSVSNAAAFFLARASEIKGIVLTISQEELSFESALWLAQSYLESGELDLALVGGCDVFTPSVEDYRQRMNLNPGHYRNAPMGEGSSWLLLGGSGNCANKLGDIMSVELENSVKEIGKASSDHLLKQCEDLAERFLPAIEDRVNSRLFLPGFRLFDLDEASWKKHGWDIDDYLPLCGISSTASAFGLAQALLSRKSTLVVHCNQHASGRQALIAAVTR